MRLHLGQRLPSQVCWRPALRGSVLCQANTQRVQRPAVGARRCEGMEGLVSYSSDDKKCSLVPAALCKFSTWPEWSAVDGHWSIRISRPFLQACGIDRNVGEAEVEHPECVDRRSDAATSIRDRSRFGTVWQHGSDVADWLEAARVGIDHAGGSNVGGAGNVPQTLVRLHVAVEDRCR